MICKRNADMVAADELGDQNDAPEDEPQNKKQKVGSGEVPLNDDEMELDIALGSIPLGDGEFFGSQHLASNLRQSLL